MTLETALLSAVTALTAALCYVVALLWGRSEKCEADRVSMRLELEKLKLEFGHSSGRLELYERCNQPNCPFTRKPTTQNPV